MDKNVTHKEIKYNTEYNENLRPLTDTSIITVEISPTGSGKTHFYKNSPNTIMLMPTNALVRANDGLISPKSALDGDRTKWCELYTDKCDYMTYDKFAGHLQYENISSLNIIIDEAHNLLNSDKEIYQELIMKLLKREVEYKELKLISATLREETLQFYKGVVFDSCVYRRKDFKPHINFVFQFPKIDPTQRTLIFINSVDKMYVIEKHFNQLYPNMKILIIKSGVLIPEQQEIEQYQLILSTSVMKEGHSIANKIDKLIIHNKFNADGAIGILQYMARPRNQSPETYVIMAETHFNSDNFPKHQDNLEMTKLLLEVANNLNNPSSHRNEVIILYLNTMQAKINQIDYFKDPSLSSYLYEKVIKSMELYYDVADFMKLSLEGFIPAVTVDVIKVLEEQESIKFPRIDISDYLSTLRKCSSDTDIATKVSTTVDELIKQIKDESIEQIDAIEKKRIVNKLEKIKKVTPILEFRMEDKIYRYTDEIIIEQMVDEMTFKRCSWHQSNLENNIYLIREQGMKPDRRLKVEKNQLVSKIENKFKGLISLLKLSKKKIDIEENKNKESLKLLERIYSFDKYDIDNKYLKAQITTKAKYVKITALYPVLESWYNLKKESGLN